MLSESQNTRDGIDLISNLEDNVLRYIISFLPTKDAIRTSILSTRWKYLWTSISIIELDDPSRGSRYKPSFLEFVDRVLYLHDGSDIKRLVLTLHQPVVSALLNSWICAAVKHNIQDLELYQRSYPTIMALPCSLFTCESLQALKLSVDCDLQLPTFIRLSHLKKLHLGSVTFVDEESVERLFSGCPVLEELEFSGCGWENIRNVTITIPTLKKLRISQDIVPYDVLSCVINIYAAKLVSLHCYTFLGVDFSLHGICSLVNASIESVGHEAIQHDRLFNLVASAYNAKSLVIFENSLESLADTEDLLDRLPTFHNLTNLTVSSEFNGWESTTRALMDLLEKSPKLECLNFAEGFGGICEEPCPWERVPSCIEDSLETCIISRFSGEDAEMHMLRYLLNNAKKLEKITLYNFDPSDEKLEKKLNKELEMLRNGPEKCLIELLTK